MRYHSTHYLPTIFAYSLAIIHAALSTQACLPSITSNRISTSIYMLFHIQTIKLYNV